MKMKRSIILILVMLTLLSVALAGCLSPLTAAQKAEIKDAFIKEYFGEEFYRGEPMVWFDENGGKRDPGVFRYFGTYGDCIVMIRYKAVDKILSGGRDNMPVKLTYLAREVTYPVCCDIHLYNTNPNYPKDSGRYTLHAPLAEMSWIMKNDLGWLTDEELEQLTTDLENWLAEGNY